MLKKIILTFAIIAVLISVGIFYVNKVLLPVQIKGLIVKATEDALGRKVSMDSLQYNVLKGFVINNITIFSKENPEEIFIHLDSASAQVLFPALIQKKIILPSVQINNLSARIIRLNASTWNFSDLLPKQGTSTTASVGAPPAAPMDLIIGGLSINNARVKLTDRIGGDNFSEMFDPINIKGSLDLTGSIHLAGGLAIPSTNGTMNFNVSVALKNMGIKADINLANIVTNKYLRFIPEGIRVPVKSLNIIRTSSRITIENKNITITGSALLKDIDAEPVAGITTRGTLELNTIAFALTDNNITVQGSLTAPDAIVEMPNDQKFNASVKTSGTTLTLKGADWNLTTDANINNLTAIISDKQKFQADISLARLSAAQTGANITAKADITVNNLIAGISDIRVKSGITAPGSTFELVQGTIDIKAKPVFKALEVALAQHMTFSGAPALVIHASLPPKDKGELHYDGIIEFNNSTLNGAPTIGDIRNIAGTLQFKTNEATLDAITFSVFDSPISVSGTVKDFTSLNLNLKADALNLDLGIIEKAVPQIIKDNGLVIHGKADVHADIQGKAATLINSGLNINAALKRTDITSDKLKQAISNVNGTIIYNAPTLTWKDLSIDFQKKTYTLNGYLQDFQNPTVATSLKADNMSADVQVKKTGDTLTIDSFNASYFDSSMTATGKVFIPTGKAPTIDITSTTKTSLRDIPKILPDLAKQIEPLKLAGILTITSHVKGNPVDWQHLNSTIKIETPTLNVMGYTATSLSIDTVQQDGQLQPLEIKARLYDGDVDVIGSVNLVKANFPFESTIKLEKTNLELLKQDTPLKAQRLSGLFSASGSLNGNASGLKSLTGKLTTQITDGYLVDIDLFTKILRFLASSFQGGNLIITDESGTFTFNDGKAETNDLTLKSATTSLIAEGWLDMMDQTVDLNITPRLEPASTTGAEQGVQGQDLLSLVNPTQGLVNVHITGSITKPKIEPSISAPTIIKKTLQNTVGGLLKLFE